MDMLCQRCGEPWDLYGVQHGDMTPEERDRFLAGRGCPSCYGKRQPELSERQKTAVAAQRAMREVLGDDLDGLVAEMEDLGLT